MTDMSEGIIERAADKLSAELGKIKKETGGDNRKVQTRRLALAVGEMLIRFIYQSEDFAAAVYERDARLMTWARDTVTNHWTTGISDVEAYAEAVKYYMPGATVRATFRIDAPKETDDDLGELFELNAPSGAAEPEHKAIILDLFDPGEISSEGEV